MSLPSVLRFDWKFDDGQFVWDKERDIIFDAATSDQNLSNANLIYASGDMMMQHKYQKMLERIDIDGSDSVKDYPGPDHEDFIEINRMPTKNDAEGYYRYDDGKHYDFIYVENNTVRSRVKFRKPTDDKHLTHPDFFNINIEKVHVGEGARWIKDQMAKLAHTFDIKDYYLKILVIQPGQYLNWHRDGEVSLASFNFLIGEGMDPVEFDDGVYPYKSALLNIQNFHKVENTTDQNRITLKLTSRDKTYEELYKAVSEYQAERYTTSS